MRARDITVITVLLAAIAATVVLFSQDPAPSEAPTPSGPIEPVAEPTEAEPPPRVDVTAEAAGRAPRADARDEVEHDEPKPTSGVIEGRVSIAVDLIGRIKTYRVRIVELVNPVGSSDGHVPYDRVVPEAFAIPDDHTPRFRVEDVPFSRFGYRVELLAVGCNGSSQIVRLSEDEWFAEVSLALTSPATFAIRVRDQHTNPHAGWNLELRPIGDPPGRSGAAVQTDRFGTAIVEGLVQGEYSVWHEGHELDRIKVQPATPIARSRPIAPQSATIVVPTGKTLRVEIFGPAGIGIEGVELTLYRVDTTANRRHEAESGFGGVHEFRHLEDGRYQLDVAAEGMQRTTRTLRVPDDLAEPLKVVLIPLR